MSENLKGEIVNGVLYIEQDGEIKEIETPIEKQNLEFITSIH